MNFTFNKALGAGASSGGLTALGLVLLDVLNWVQPLAAAVPVLGVAVGVGTFILTWLTKANAPKATATL